MMKINSQKRIKMLSKPACEISEPPPFRVLTDEGSSSEHLLYSMAANFLEKLVKFARLKQK
jgi:hypothetical protein